MSKVSLIIPVYNVEKCVEESLQSALNQTYEDIEFVIIDDCSTDHSMDIVTKLVEQHPRKERVIVYRHSVNSGLSEARNTGIRKATGEYIFFMDSDDTIIPECIELHIKAVESSKADFSVANHKVLGKSTMHKQNLVFTEKNREEIIQSFFAREWSNSAWNKLINRKLLLENSIYFVKGLMYEDLLWAFRLALCARKLAVVKENTYNYIIRKNSITTSSVSVKKIEALIYTIGQICEIANKICDSHSIKTRLNSYLTFLRFNTSLMLINNDGKWCEKRKLYQQINSKHIRKYNNHSIMTFLLQLPYVVFHSILFIPYKLYKKIQ